MSIKFYYAPQSSAERVHDTLAALGVPYEEVRVDLRAGDQKKPEFLAINPNGKVPTIILDGTPMFESVAIQIALGERYGVEKGLWPALGSPEHHTTLTWLLWAQISLVGAMYQYIANTGDWSPKESHNALQAASSLAETKSLLTILDQHLTGRGFLAGERCSLADIDIASILGWGLMMVKIPATDYPNIAAWLERTNKRVPQHSAS